MLLFSWNGRGEAAQLTAAESAQALAPLPSPALMSAFYLNELLLKLTTRHDPHPMLFDTYHEALDGLRAGGPLEPQLRVFEKRLLEALGYGLDLTRIDSDEYYLFRPEQGLVPTVADATGALAGRSLLSLANEHFTEARELEDSKRLLQAALAQCLEGRPINTRTVARAVARREAHTGSQS